MDSNVHDVTERMDDTASEDSTCQSSESSRTLVNPEASQPHQLPFEKQASVVVSFEFPKRRRCKAKLPAGKPAAAADPKPQIQMDVSKQTQNSQPLFKQPTVVDPNKVYLWNSGGKRKNKKAPRELIPQIVVIDKIPIYIKKLTAAQAVATGVKGWDKVLSDVEQLHPDAAVSCIASFWAGWKRQLQLTRREEAKILQIAKTGATPNQTTPPSS